MASPNRRFFRRNPDSEGFVASGQQINLSSTAAIDYVLKIREKWQVQCYDAYDAVGEIKFGVNVLASLVSRITLFVAKASDERDAEPNRIDPKTPKGDESKILDTFNRLGDALARSDLQREYALNILIAGECYLIAVAARPAVRDRDGQIVREASDEYWCIRSVEELEKKDGKIRIRDIETDYISGGDLWITLDQPGDTFIRLWRQHPRRHHKADSHIRAILGQAEELLWWDAAAIARAKQRLGDSGVVMVPSDMDTPAQSEEDEKLTGAQRTAKTFHRAAIEPIKDPGTAQAASPVFATYIANEQRKSGLEYITFERPQDELLELRTERSLKRIEQGIDLPAGVISGLGHATHWGGGQIEESTFREHVEPLVILMCSALTKAFLQPILRQLGIKDHQSYLIWYDASPLVIHPDQPTQSNRGVELGALSLAAWRRVNGHSEKDAPTDEERLEILEWLQTVRSGQNQGIVENPQTPQEPRSPTAPPKQNLPGDRTPVEQPAAPMKRTGQPVVGSVHDISLLQLQVMADERIRRALEKAGNKLRSRAKKKAAYANALRGVEAEDVARTLGRDAVLKLGYDDLFDGCFETVPARFAAITNGSLEGFSTSTGKRFVSVLKEYAAKSLFVPPEAAYIVPLSAIQEVLVNPEVSP